MSLCFFLLGKNNHLLACAYPKHHSAARVNPSTHRYWEGTAADNYSLTLKAGSPKSKAGAEEMPVTEIEEEEEQVPFRRCFDICHYYITYLSLPHTADDDACLSNRLPFCNHFSPGCSDIFIVNRVIRV